MIAKGRFYRRINLRQYDFWVFFTVIILLAMGLVMIFSASAPRSVAKFGWRPDKAFYTRRAPLLAGAYYCIMNIKMFEYMKDRVLAFMNPGLDPLGDDWQIVNSLYAIGSGGLFGKGIGRSMQKFFISPSHITILFSP